MATSPKRLLSLIFVISYYIFAVIRPFAAATTMRHGNVPVGVLHIPQNFPLVRVLDAFLFAAFLVLSLPLLMQLSSYNRTMRAADIDVLFATPVSPRLVMGLRVLRDYLATLIVPLFIVIFTWRPVAMSGIIANLPHPETAGYLVRTAMCAWILIAMVWTIYGYAATLFVNRSDLASERNARVLKGVLTVIVVATVFYVAIGLRVNGASLATALGLADSLALRGTFFIAHLGSLFALGPITGLWHTAVSGALILLLMALGFAIALSEVGWMYDQAAVRGFETMESMRLRRSGDSSAILANSAKQGKLKSGRQTRLHRLRVRPGAAMIWREAVIQLRTFRTSMVLVLIFAVVYSLLPVFIFRSAANAAGTGAMAARTLQSMGWIFLACQGFGLFMYVMSTSATGYVELLRRVDLMKPLPFTPARLMTTEVFAKTYIPIVMSVGCTLIAMVVCPPIWQFGVANLMYGPSFAVMLSSVVLVVTLLFPEIDDPTQRGFRGMMQMLAVAIAIAPGLFTDIAITAFGHSPILGGFMGMAINMGITVALTACAGYLYMGFNPTE